MLMSDLIILPQPRAIVNSLGSPPSLLDFQGAIRLGASIELPSFRIRGASKLSGAVSGQNPPNLVSKFWVVLPTVTCDNARMRGGVHPRVVNCLCLLTLPRGIFILPPFKPHCTLNRAPSPALNPLASHVQQFIIFNVLATFQCSDPTSTF